MAHGQYLYMYIVYSLMFRYLIHFYLSIQNTYGLSNKLTPWSWALLEKPPVAQTLKRFPTFYGTRRFITVFKRALHWSLSWARSVQSTPSHPISLRSFLTLPSHLRLGFLSGPFPTGVFTKILFAFLFSSCMPHACTLHTPWLNHSNYIWRRVQVMKLLIIQFSPASCHILPSSVQNIFLSILFSNTVSLCSSLNVRGKVSHPYKTIGKIIVCIL
jgi:hypothetical protein